jgi:hypothetical protein
MAFGDLRGNSGFGVRMLLITSARAGMIRESRFFQNDTTSRENLPQE